MALHVSVKAERSQFSVRDSDPAPTPSSSDGRNGNLMTQGADTQAEELGRAPGSGFWQPTKKYSDADPCIYGTLAQRYRDDSACTPPIDVPRPKADGDAQWRGDNVIFGNGVQDSELFLDQEVEAFLRNRRPSITFSPEKTLDSGGRLHLEEPLPKLTIGTKPIDKIALKELESYPSRFSALHRTHSEADIRKYDPVTGAHLEQRPSIFDGQLDLSKSSHFNLNGHIPTPAETPKLDSLNIDQATSLTSDATISTIAEEARTPPENMEILTSPISAFSPFVYPTSYEDSSAWPRPRRRMSTKPNPFTFERTSSMHSSRRNTSRRSTSSPLSPASSFLSRFAIREEKPTEPDSEGQVIGEYVLGKQLGYGGFSVVKEAFTIEGDEKVTRAAKIVRKQLHGRDEAENDRLQAEFEHEVSIWRCLGHRNILPLIEVYDTSFATFCFTKLNTGGTLFDKIRANRKGLDGNLSRRYAYQLASAIRYLHEDVHIVHRDIKLENCLLDTSDPVTAAEGGNVLLCDFGLAEFVANDMRTNSPDPFAPYADRLTSHTNDSYATHLSAQTHTNCSGNAHLTSPALPSDAATSIAGSLQYASPELILSPAGLIDPVVDIWAYGVVMYAICTGDLPFQHVFQPRVQMMILAGEWDQVKLENCRAAQEVGGRHSERQEEIMEFVTGCLDMRSEQRWNVGMVLGSRWLRGMQEMLEEREGGFRL